MLLLVHFTTALLLATVFFSDLASRYLVLSISSDGAESLIHKLNRMVSSWLSSICSQAPPSNELETYFLHSKKVITMRDSHSIEQKQSYEGAQMLLRRQT